MSNSWPLAPLRALLTKSEEWIDIKPEERYREITVRLWGKGVTLRREVSGTEIAASRRLRVKAGQFILSRIDARNGAFGLVPDALDGAIVSNDFPVFTPNSSKILPLFLSWMSKTHDFVNICKAASEGTTNRVRLREDRFLDMKIPIPSFPEQRRIVARIDELAAKIDEARMLRVQIEKHQEVLLAAAYRRIAANAPWRPLGDVAPLTRRPVAIDPEKEYPQIAVRSFGRGTFHKPPLRGSEVTWQKPFLVKAGDVLISNIKAWEGAIGVASSRDNGRVGSHRYLTCVPLPDVATARFVCFYLLTPEGLHEVGEASPGTADRNRTLNSRALLRILIPVPPFEQQLWFDKLCQQVDVMKPMQAETAAELEAMLPSILDRAFKGEL